jgi:hypothetical protein
MVWKRDDKEIPLATIAFTRSSAVDASAIQELCKEFGRTFAFAFKAFPLYPFSCNHWQDA